MIMSAGREQLQLIIALPIYRSAAIRSFTWNISGGRNGMCARPPFVWISNNNNCSSIFFSLLFNPKPQQREQTKNFYFDCIAVSFAVYRRCMAITNKRRKRTKQKRKTQTQLGFIGTERGRSTSNFTRLGGRKKNRSEKSEFWTIV